jgi:voltage-gated potassium channel Kch
MWWAVATLTTVGYGDIYPITGGGRFFTFVVLILGLGVIAVPTGLVASALTNLKGGESGGEDDETDDDIGESTEPEPTPENRRSEKG